MLYNLSNGCQIWLKNNVEVAKFVFFVSPRDGVHLVNKPVIHLTPEIQKLMDLRERLSINIARDKDRKMEELINNFPDFDDDIPF